MTRMQLGDLFLHCSVGHGEAQITWVSVQVLKAQTQLEMVFLFEYGNGGALSARHLLAGQGGVLSQLVYQFLPAGQSLLMVSGDKLHLHPMVFLPGRMRSFTSSGTKLQSVMVCISV